MTDSFQVRPIAGGVEFAVKVVPNSSRDRIVGPLGDALKVAVAAPPEDGKANAAVCRLIAGALGVPVRDVAVVAGHWRPHKKLAVRGVTPADAAKRLFPPPSKGGAGGGTGK